MRPSDYDRPPQPGSTGTYNAFWFDSGDYLRQTSLIIDPADGRIPWTAEAVRRRAERRRGPSLDAPEQLSLADRCITRGAPKLPGGYNNNFQIVQTRDHVAIMQEMIHEARIIPLDGRPHAPSSVPLFLGDSRGRWEGDTLVIETTNFNSKVGTTSFNCCGGSAENLHLVERFTMIDADNIEHRYTVEDPTAFTRPWTVSVPLRRVNDQIFEYACHEANYSMEGMLRGARAAEKRAEDSRNR
jgi:hypothetical protein